MWKKMRNVWERFHNGQHYKPGNLFCQKIVMGK